MLHIDASENLWSMIRTCWWRQKFAHDSKAEVGNWSEFQTRDKHFVFAVNFHQCLKVIHRELFQLVFFISNIIVISCWEIIVFDLGTWNVLPCPNSIFVEFQFGISIRVIKRQVNILIYVIHINFCSPNISILNFFEGWQSK